MIVGGHVLDVHVTHLIKYDRLAGEPLMNEDLQDEFAVMLNALENHIERALPTDNMPAILDRGIFSIMGNFNDRLQRIEERLKGD